MSSAPKILRLDEVVVNRIAAGEVIQRPANAIKEMIENSIDAKSKSIQVTVKQGGLKLIQMQDDGCGIRKEDMKIVCERFTTSKLNSFDDLKSISTYGFRGEALASISHVAHLIITTKTAESPCAFKAKYEDGKIVPLLPGGPAEPKPCAGNKGTQITVEDLFYNVTVRRKAFKSPNEEHLKITDMISKYSIHNPKISFTFKKFGENIADVRTQPNSTVLNNIKIIYGPTVARELLEVEKEDEKYGFKLHGYISNANYSMKKFTFLLFINHRLVESTSLKKALDVVYVNYLPKDKHPFVYMSLEINPLNIDVNVHPTKHEVKFLHEDVIIEQIQKCVETKLLGANESRHYYTQMLLPKMVTAGLDCPVSGVVSDKSKDVQRNVYAHQMVRTDARERKLQAFFNPSTDQENLMSQDDARIENIDSTLPQNVEITDDNTNRSEHTENMIEVEKNSTSMKSSNNNNIDDNDVDMIVQEQSAATTTTSSGHVKNITSSKPNDKVIRKRKRTVEELTNVPRVIKLSSIKKLRELIDQKEHLGLKNLLEDHKFVGCVNQSLALIQHLTRLYLVSTQKLTRELFYQILIFKFGNFGYIELSSPAPIYELVLLALNSPDSGWKPDDGDKEELAKFVVDLLQDKGDMTMDYFSMEINKQGELISLPLILDKYVPNWNRLPMFLLRLATEIDWDNEQDCFDGFSRECSLFYSYAPDEYDDEEESDEKTGVKSQWEHTIEHIIYPALRTSLIPPKSFSEDGSFLEVANLPDLYKVFERC